jgi:hypothetical protein
MINTIYFLEVFYRMYVWWILIILTVKTVAEQSRSELTNDGDHLQTDVSTKN